jgi:hypothetical protein
MSLLFLSTRHHLVGNPHPSPRGQAGGPHTAIQNCQRLCLLKISMFRVISPAISVLVPGYQSDIEPIASILSTPIARLTSIHILSVGLYANLGPRALLLGMPSVSRCRNRECESPYPDPTGRVAWTYFQDPPCRVHRRRTTARADDYLPHGRTTPPPNRGEASDANRQLMSAFPL